MFLPVLVQDGGGDSGDAAVVISLCRGVLMPNAAVLRCHGVWVSLDIALRLYKVALPGLELEQQVQQEHAG